MAGVNIEAPDDTNLNESVALLGLDLPDLERIIADTPWDKLGYL